MRIAALLTTISMLAPCSAPTPSNRPPDVNPEARIETIPAADPAKYTHVRNYKNWQNPFLIVRADGIALLDVQNNEEHILKPDELTQALGNLPATAWPYGRVVAVQENAVRNPSREDEISIRRNRGILAGTLESQHVLINWIPPA